jgi:hypothetical protein
MNIYGDSTKEPPIAVPLNLFGIDEQVQEEGKASEIQKFSLYSLWLEIYLHNLGLV